MTTQPTNQVKAFFALGRTLATPGALVVLNGLSLSPAALLSRHQCGDWGDLDRVDQQTNNKALLNGGRIFSAYRYDTVKFWVITEADHSATTILLPEEY